MAIENTYWKNVLTVVPIVGAAIATLTYLLRLVSCRISTVGLRLEDLLMGIGLILSYCATAFVIYSRFLPRRTYRRILLTICQQRHSMVWASERPFCPQMSGIASNL